MENTSQLDQQKNAAPPRLDAKQRIEQIDLVIEDLLDAIRRMKQEQELLRTKDGAALWNLSQGLR